MRNGAQAASLIRRIIEEFHKSGISGFNVKKPEPKLMKKQIVGGKQSKDAILRKVPKEEHLAYTYRFYLSSTVRLEALQEQYKGGERSLEESAELVGLKLPASKA